MTILDEGQLLIITGHMGSGKTFFANVMTERKAKKGFHIYTNINYFKPDSWEKAKKKGLLRDNIEYVEPPKNVHIINRMSELLKGLPRTKQNIVILDEAMIYAGFDRKGSRVERWIKQFIITSRKINTSVVLVIQAKSQLTRLLREQLEHWEVFCQKYNGKYIGRMYKYFPNGERKEGPVRMLPSTGHYPYDSKAPASLKMDVEMENFLDDVSEYDSIELEEHIDELVEKWSFEPEPKKDKKKGPTKTDCIIKTHVEHPEWTQKQVATHCKCSLDLVKNRWR